MGWRPKIVVQPRRRTAALLILAAAVSLPGGARDARDLYGTGRTAQGERNFPRAIELYRAALEENPHYVEPMIGLAESFFRLEEYEEALRYVEEARRHDRSLALMSLEGRIRIGLGDIDGARFLFEQVLLEEPNNLDARFGAAALEVRAGNTSRAVETYLTTLRLDPQSRRALLSLAVIYRRLGDQTTADRYLELALRYHANDPMVHFAAGESFLEAGEMSAAARHLRLALSLQSDFHLARRQLGIAYLLDGEIAQAVSELQQAVGARRDDFLAWYLLGIAYRDSGREANAFSAFEQAIAVRPDDEVARIALENLVLDELDPEDPMRSRLAMYHWERGITLERRNLLDAAQLEFLRSLFLNPMSRDGRMSYARIYRLIGFPIKYLEELEFLQFLGFQDLEISDEIEWLRRITADGVARTWGVDQYDIMRQSTRVAVFHVEPNHATVHPMAGDELTRYVVDILSRHETIQIPVLGARVDEFAEAFRNARASNSVYFVLLRFLETERSFAIESRVYRADTGAALASFDEYRTGNDRIRDAADATVRTLAALIPERFILMAREFDRGIIDGGRQSGIEPDDTLIIVRKGALDYSHDVLALTYAPDAVLGEFSVLSTDERISEGEIRRRDFFDFINPGDELVLVSRDAAEPPPSDEPRGFLARLLQDLLGIQ